MLIVSFDIASKSLALSLIDFNDNYHCELNEITSKFSKDIKNMDAITTTTHALDIIDQIGNVYDNIANLLLIDVVDLIPGKKVKDTTPMLRSSRLAGYLQKVDELIHKQIKSGYRGKQEIKVLLEYQMSSNFKSNFIFAQIMGHFSKKTYEFENTTCLVNSNVPQELEFDVIVIGPSLKNKLELDKTKCHAYFMGKYAKKYDANKAHTKANLLFWLNQNNKSHMIKGVKRKNVDDIADSVIQALAWIIIKFKRHN